MNGYRFLGALLDPHLSSYRSIVHRQVVHAKKSMPKRNVQQRREGRHALLSSLGGVNQYKLNAHKSGWEQAAKTQARYVEFEKVKSLPEIKYRNRFRSSKERGMLVEKFTKLKIERYGQHMYSPIKSIKKDYEYDRVLRFTPDDLQLRANKKKTFYRHK